MSTKAKSTAADFRGLYVPLVTPMFHGDFDEQSMKKLIHTLEPFADGYVPCLSSGEGDVLSATAWKQVLSCVRVQTRKPIIAGIKKKSPDEIISMSKIAATVGCEAVIIPTPDDGEAVGFFQSLASTIDLPIIIYNTEHAPITDAAAIQKLDATDGIIGLKDSSLDTNFFTKLVSLKESGHISLCLFQGMENKLLESKGCGGFMVSLLNVEPELCRNMLETPSVENNKKVLDAFWQYNLGGEWYVTLKAVLHCRGILRSAEQVNQSIAL